MKFSQHFICCVVINYDVFKAKVKRDIFFLLFLFVFDILSVFTPKKDLDSCFKDKIKIDLDVKVQ